MQDLPEQPETNFAAHLLPRWKHASALGESLVQRHGYCELYPIAGSKSWQSLLTDPDMWVNSEELSDELEGIVTFLVADGARKLLAKELAGLVWPRRPLADGGRQLSTYDMLVGRADVAWRSGASSVAIRGMWGLRNELLGSTYGAR